jgi:hypothetical protein
MVNYRYFTVRIEAIFLTFFLDFSDGAIKQKINHSKMELPKLIVTFTLANECKITS